MSEKDIRRRPRRMRGTQLYDLKEEAAPEQKLDLMTDNFSGRKRVSSAAGSAKRPERPARRREEVSVDLPASRKPARSERPARQREGVSVDLPASRKPVRSERPARRREEVSVDLPASRKPVRSERPVRRREETELSIDLPVRRRAWKDEVYPPEAAQETRSGKKKMIRDASAKTKNHRRDAEPVRKTAAERKPAGKVSAGKTSAEKMSAGKVPVDEETFDRSTKNTGESVRPADGLQVSVSPKHSPSRGDAGKRPAFDGEREKKDADRRMAQAAQERIRRKKKKGGFFGILLGLFLFVSVIFAAGYVYTQGKLDLIQRLPWNRNNIANTGLSADTMARMKGYWTVAVFGVDSRDSNLGKGTNADVNMIVSINHDTGDIRLVSVYRDTYMKVSDKVYNKLNAAYQSGGPESSVWALNRNLDVNIDDYVTFNWKAVAQAINILGGIDVEITKDEFFYINAFISETVEATGIGSHQLKEAGMNHLDGVQAVAYGRLRLMDSDFKRTERQRTVIQLALEKMKKADLSTLNSLVETVFPEVATSADVSDALRMAANVGHYHIAGSYGFPENNKLSRVKGRGSVVAPATLASNVTLLHKFLFDVDDYAPSETVQAISKHVSEVTNVAEMKEKPKEEAKTAGENAEIVSDRNAAVQETSAAKTAETNQTTAKTASAAKQTAQKTASTAKQTAQKTASSAKQTAQKTASTAKQTAQKTASTAKQTAQKTASSAKKTAQKTASSSKSTAKKAASGTQQNAKKAKSAKKTA